jgi:hypothetical protein
MIRRCLPHLLAAFVLSLSPLSAFAQKAPEAGYVYPPGAAAGTTIDVRLGGYDWTPDVQIFVSDPRVTLELLGLPGEILVPPPPYWFGPKSTSPGWPIPRETPARLTVPADMPPGPVRWTVANANGGSTHGVFHVGDAAEVLEDERTRTPQELPALPCAVNGRIIKLEDVDRYRFRAERTGPVTCELFARRLGANFNGVLEVRDAAGRLLADAADTTGRDLALTFAATAGEEYTLSLFDLDFRGDWSFVYRLRVAAEPRIVVAIPVAGRRGETREVRFLGYGIATGAAMLESVTAQVAFPADPAAIYSHRLETPFGTARYDFALSNLTEEIEPAGAAATLQALTVPAAITGMLSAVDEEDVYTIAGKMGEVLNLSLTAREHGSPLDVVFRVLGPDGMELIRHDDLPGTTDAGFSFAVPADGEYRVVVSDASGSAGAADAIYRLAVERPAADFALRTGELLSVPLGGTADLTVTATRYAGFVGPIALVVSGLPEGVTAPADLVIPPEAAELKVTLTSAADGPSFASPVTVTGTAIVGDATVARIALAPAGGNLASRRPLADMLPRTLVSVTMKPRCRVSPVDRDGGRTVHRGATYPADVIVERLEGFSGEVLLRMAGRQSYHQQGIRGDDLIVPPGVGRIPYPVFMPEWLETSRTSRMILIGVAQVPDPRGNLRWLVSNMEGRITMSVEGALMKVSHEAEELRVRPGGSFDVPLTLSRSPKLPESAEIELVVPEELAGLLSAQPVVLSGDAVTGALRVETVADPRLLGEHVLTVRATALQHGYLPAVSECEVTVEFVE